jgi:hypothetical protein
MSAKKTTTNPAGKTKARAGKKAKTGDAVKKMSALDAAAKVLKEKGTAMSCQELIGAMAGKGYWSSPNGKTPAATLYAAILREVATKGPVARFRKTAPGHFTATDSPAAKQQPATEEATPPKKSKGKKAKKPAKAKPDAPIADGTPGPESIAELLRI